MPICALRRVPPPEKIGTIRVLGTDSIGMLFS
jgi:hypothetical protein